MSFAGGIAQGLQSGMQINLQRSALDQDKKLKKQQAREKLLQRNKEMFTQGAEALKNMMINGVEPPQDFLTGLHTLGRQMDSLAGMPMSGGLIEAIMQTPSKMEQEQRQADLERQKEEEQYQREQERQEAEWAKKEVILKERGYSQQQIDEVRYGIKPMPEEKPPGVVSYQGPNGIVQVSGADKGKMALYDRDPLYIRLKDAPSYSDLNKSEGIVNLDIYVNSDTGEARSVNPRDREEIDAMLEQGFRPGTPEQQIGFKAKAVLRALSMSEEDLDNMTPEQAKKFAEEYTKMWGASDPFVALMQQLMGGAPADGSGDSFDDRANKAASE